MPIIIELFYILYITLGMILLIVPGIILSLRYKLIMYYAICFGETFRQAKDTSSKAMFGYKLYFFLLK